MVKRIQQTDVEIGRRIRLHRLTKGMSQMEVASFCGITFQQIQKYENGTNRVGGSRLQQIANVLGVAPAAFFDAGGTGGDNPIGGEIAELLTQPGAIRLLRNYVKLPPPLRYALARFTAGLAGEADADEMSGVCDGANSAARAHQ